jgi:hypothetical protein
MKCTRQRCTGAEKHRPHRLAEAEVRIGDHQPDPAQAAGLQRAEERGPERAVLAVSDVHAEDFPVAVGPDADGDHDGLGDDLVVDPGLAVGRVEEHVRVGRGGERTAAEGGDLVIQIGADP